MSTLTKHITVTDENGNPLSGVNILISSGVGTTTNQNGMATVQSPSQNQVITLSHIGHTTETYSFRDLPTHVLLITETASLDEVVIVAKKKKKTDPWLWAGIAATLLLLGGALSSNNEPEPVGLSKPKQKSKQKKSTKTISVTL